MHDVTGNELIKRGEHLEATTHRTSGKLLHLAVSAGTRAYAAHRRSHKVVERKKSVPL